MNPSACLRSALVLCCTTFLFHAHSLVPQETPAQDLPPFKIQVDTNKVLLPVVVRDKEGRTVSDLKKEDFQVFDNDKPHAVSAFSIERNTEPANSPQKDTQPPSLTGFKPQSSTGIPRFIIFLFDDLHLSIEDLAHAKAASSRLLTEVFIESDMAAVIAISGTVNTGLTRDRTKLQEAIGNLKQHGLYHHDGSECPDIDYYQADQIQNKHDSVALAAAIQQVFNCSPGMDRQRDQNTAERLAESAAMRAVIIGHQDVQVTYASMAEYVRRVAALPGQRTIVLVSSGFLSPTMEEKTEESKVMDLAAQSNVIINAMDARGLYTTELSASERSPGQGRILQLKTDNYRSSQRANENVMSEIAEATGGIYFHNSNDLDAGLKAVTAMPDCIYMLELSLSDVKANGSYHRLKVKVDQKDLKLQTRHGYFAPKPEKKQK